MGPTVLLLALLVHSGISNKLYYRYSGVVTIIQENGGANKYELQLCSLNTSICQLVTTYADCNANKNLSQVSENKMDFVFMSNNANGGDSGRLSSVLASATNCSAITPTVSIHTKLVTITTTIKLLAPTPSMDNHPAAMCTNTYTTTVSISNSVAPTPAVNSCRNTAKIFNVSQAALGAMIGILGVLLAIVSISWIGTCWAMKKSRRKRKINTIHIRYGKKQATNSKHNKSEMQIRYRNDYHNEMGNTQQESSEDRVQQDLSAERVYDVINTPAGVHNATTTNIQVACTEQHTYMATEQQQISQNDTPGHRDMESHSNRQNQTRLNDDSQEEQTSTHIYHILEQQSEEHVELKNHKPAAEYEVPVTNMAVHHQ